MLCLISLHELVDKSVIQTCIIINVVNKTNEQILLLKRKKKSVRDHRERNFLQEFSLISRSVLERNLI